MQLSNSFDIKAIVFDLDGTLHVSDEFAVSIKHEAARYMAGVLSVSTGQAHEIMNERRRCLAEQDDMVPTLSNVCCSLGGKIPEMHAYFERKLRPESYLLRDERVILLLKGLARYFDLYIYTNNNRVLATRILDYLGLNGLFRHIFTIEDTWKPKPDQEQLEKIIASCGHSPAKLLFVGDRYDVDLRLPEQLGCPVFLSQSVEQLLRLQKLIPAG